METRERIRKEEGEFLHPYIDRVVEFYVKPRWQSVMSGKVWAIVKRIPNDRLILWRTTYFLEVLNEKKGNLMPSDIDKRTFRPLSEAEGIIKRLELETTNECGMPRDYFPYITNP